MPAASPSPTWTTPSNPTPPTLVPILALTLLGVFPLLALPLIVARIRSSGSELHRGHYLRLARSSSPNSPESARRVLSPPYKVSSGQVPVHVRSWEAMIPGVAWLGLKIPWTSYSVGQGLVVGLWVGLLGFGIFSAST